MSHLVVVDHPLFTEAVSCFFKNCLPWPVTFLPVESIHRVPPHSTVVLELFLPQEQSGIDLARRLQQSRADVTTIVWTTKPAPIYIWAGLEYRIRGFLDKAMPIQGLVHWLNHAMSNGAAWSGEMLVLAERWNQVVASRLQLLTEDLWVLWDRLLQGDTNQQVAFHLGWSKRTIERRLTTLYTMLDVYSRSEAINLAWKWRLVRSNGHEFRWSRIVPDLFLPAQPLRDAIHRTLCDPDAGLQELVLGERISMVRA